MKILDLNKINYDVYRFISDNQNKLPVCIVSESIDSLKKSIMILEEHDFKFRLDGLKIIVFE
jgi:hypothetical protein